MPDSLRNGQAKRAYFYEDGSRQFSDMTFYSERSDNVYERTSDEPLTMSLAAIARTAGREAIGIPIVVKFPGPNRSNKFFLSGSRTAVDTAAGQEELLVKYGLAPGHLAGISTVLDQLEQLSERRDQVGQKRTGANRELGAVVKDLIVVMVQLDAINRHRFRDDPNALGAWSTAIDLRVGPRKPAPEPPTGSAGLDNAA